MADTAEFVTTIKVRDLISAFESKSESVKVEFSRPRAKSVGNILAKNVVVRQNEFNTLDDVEKALRKLDANLNFYEVYNKAKHVDFQEQLFNILTSIINIESDAEDASVKKKKLISQTQTLVSFLNQKLPSNINQVVSSPPANQFKYTTYSSYVKENGGVETNSTKDVSSQKYIPYSEATKTVDVTDSSTDAFVSVRRLKETFQPKTEDVQKSDKKFKTEYALKVTDSTTSNGYKQEQPKQELIPDEDEHPENVSVSKLRNLFEQKSEESAKGLGIIADDKTPVVSKPAVGSFANTINFPYTERNLGNVRMQRSVSGNYMNYVGLLKRTDINRSKSVHELNRKSQVNVRATRKLFDDDSGAVSDGTLEDEGESKNIGEVKTKHYAASSENVGKITRNDAYSSEKDDIPAINIKEIIGRYSTNTNTEEQKIEHKNVEKSEYITTVKKSEETVVNYSTAVSVNVNKEPDKKRQENISSVDGVQEIKVNYLRAENIPVSNNENVASVKGIQEVNVPYATATSDNVEKTIGNDIHNLNEEDIPVVNVKELVEKYSSNIVDVNQEPDKERQENPSDIDSVQEINVNYLRADNIPVANNENVASVKGIQEVNVLYSTATSDNAEKTIESDIHKLDEEDIPVVNVKEMVEKYSSNIVDDNQEPDKKQQENVSTVDGTQEINVNYLRAENIPVEDNENVASVKGIQEVNVPYSTATSDNVEKTVGNDIHNLDEEDIPVVNVKEMVEKYSSNIADVNQEPDNEQEENVSTVDSVQEVNVNYLRAENRDLPKDENVASVKGIEEVNVPYPTVTTSDIKQDNDKENVASIKGVEEKEVRFENVENVEVSQNENIATVKGASEVNVNYSVATSVADDIKQGGDNKENVSSTEGVKEVELRYEGVESKDVSKEEHVANLKGTDEVTVSYSTATSDDTAQNSKENVVTFQGVEETVVKYSPAESKDVSDNENVANRPEVEDVTDYTSGNTPEATNSPVDVTDNISTAATTGSEDYNRDAAFTEEEIDKIDVEHTLENEDIDVNAEDLKNAEDEFEKLLERSEKEKTTT